MERMRLEKKEHAAPSALIVRGTFRGDAQTPCSKLLKTGSLYSPRLFACAGKAVCMRNARLKCRAVRALSPCSAKSGTGFRVVQRGPVARF